MDDALSVEHHFASALVLPGMMSMFLSFVTLIMCFSGSMLVLEVLGELPIFEGLEMKTQMGDISFFTMIYWTHVIQMIENS